MLSAESNVDIEALDIPVNAVATALKDFFSKHLPPLFDDKLTTELEDIAGEQCDGGDWWMDAMTIMITWERTSGND